MTIGAVPSALPTLVLSGTGAQHHVTAHVLTDTVDTHVEGVLITPGAVCHALLVSEVKPLCMWHAVQLARVWGFCVRHPIVLVAPELFVVELCALLGSEVARAGGTVLSLTREVLRVAASTRVLWSWL